MHAHAMAYGELDLLAVDHGHGTGFRIRPGRFASVHSLAEDRCVIRARDDQLGLKQPGLILERLWLFLAVDQEEGYDPVLPLASHGALNGDVGELAGRRPRLELSLLQRHRQRGGLDLAPLPDLSG